MAVFICLLVCSVWISGCENPEGIGGTASISGRITDHFYNEDFSDLILQAPAVDEEVFIQFGSSDLVGDRTITSPSGDFRFSYLFPGEYHIYYMTMDSSSGINEESERIITVELERGEEKDLGELIRLNTLDFDDGDAKIRGTVKVINYVDESRWPNLVEDYTDFAQEQEVYLIYNGRDYYDERIRTSHDGVFEFRNLIPGEYEVFLYSEDVTRVTDNVVISYDVTITEFDQVVDLGEILIEER